MNGNVLVISGGGFQGLTVIKELTEIRDTTIHVFDIHKENVGKYFCHYYTVCPSLHDAGFSSFLISYVNKYDINVIIPATAYELKILAALQHKFQSAEVRIAVSSEYLLAILEDKQRTHDWLTTNNFQVLPSLPLETLSAGMFPIIGKPFQGWGGRGIQIIENAEQFQNIDHPELYIWQRFLPAFREISVDFVINFHNMISQPVYRERLRTSGGFAVVMVEHEHEVILGSLFTKLATVLKNAGGLGFFNVQLLIADGEYYVSDINPRIGTSAVLGKKISTNLSRFLISSTGFNESQSGETSQHEKFKVVRYLEEAYIPLINLHGVKCIVFDLDDTLAPQKWWIHDKITLLANRYNNLIEDKTSFIKQALQFVEEGKAPVLIDALCNYFNLQGYRDEFIQYYRELTPETLKLYPDVLPVLKKLSRLYTLVMLTDNPVITQQQKVAVFPEKELFTHVILTDSYGVAKPEAKAFDLVCTQTKFTPNEIIMVGDHLIKDIYGALRFGFAYCFLLQRPGGFYNFDTELIEQEYAILNRKYMAIQSLRDILRYL